MNRTRNTITAAIVALVAAGCVYVPPSPWNPPAAPTEPVSVTTTTTTEAPLYWRRDAHTGEWYTVPAAEYPTTPAPAPKPTYPTTGAGL